MISELDRFQTNEKVPRKGRNPVSDKKRYLRLNSKAGFTIKL